MERIAKNWKEFARICNNMLCFVHKAYSLFMDGPILRSTPRHVATCEFSSPKQPVEMIVAKIFAINKVAGCRKDDRARDAHAIQNTIVRF